MASNSVLQILLRNSEALLAAGDLNTHTFQIASEIIQRPENEAKLTELYYTYRISGDDAEAERESCWQVLSTVIVEELNSRWNRMAILEKYPVDLAKELSQKEREQRLELDSKQTHSDPNDSLVYGEVEYSSFAEIFVNHIKLKSGGIFVDLGSGTGRAVFAAALLHNFEQCVGVELLHSLHTIAVETLNEYKRLQSNPRAPEPQPKRSRVSNKKQQEPKSKSNKKQVNAVNSWTEFNPLSVDMSHLRLENMDLRRFDWSDADVVFCAATCFDGPLLQHIADESAKLKAGSYLISLSETLRAEHLQLVKSVVYRMSWGRATVHIQQRM
eukprot:TRINITY_DN2928_c0_g1_i3.p1 TRINITY_DN2928_c0_g1~~TRINITY_DN2928_c0_g1_i3.p1  ORF type:complete len:328 (+),score=35.52 TRINITY_DN2928_c0_g1_i3:74-1057(+)